MVGQLLPRLAAVVLPLNNHGVTTFAGPGSGNFSRNLLERRSSSTAALYQLLGPIPSPFLNAELAECSLGDGTPKGQGSLPDDVPAQAHYSVAQLGSPSGPGLERRRLSRKLTGGRCGCLLTSMTYCRRCSTLCLPVTLFMHAT